MDYGNKSRVGLDLLMEIPCHLLELPFQVRLPRAPVCVRRCRLCWRPTGPRPVVGGGGLVCHARHVGFPCFSETCVARRYFCQHGSGVSWNPWGALHFLRGVWARGSRQTLGGLEPHGLGASPSGQRRGGVTVAGRSCRSLPEHPHTAPPAPAGRSGAGSLGSAWRP